MKGKKEEELCWTGDREEAISMRSKGMKRKKPTARRRVKV